MWTVWVVGIALINAIITDILLPGTEHKPATRNHPA